MLFSLLPVAWTFFSMRKFASTHYRWAGSIALLTYRLVDGEKVVEMVDFPDAPVSQKSLNRTSRNQTGTCHFERSEKSLCRVKRKISPFSRNDKLLDDRFHGMTNHHILTC